MKYDALQLQQCSNTAGSNSFIVCQHERVTELKQISYLATYSQIRVIYIYIYIYHYSIITAGPLCNPVDEPRNSRVDTRMFRLSTVETPAGDADDVPTTVADADERTTGVALASVVATLGETGAEHVIGDLIAVPVG